MQCPGLAAQLLENLLSSCSACIATWQPSCTYPCSATMPAFLLNSSCACFAACHSWRRPGLAGQAVTSEALLGRCRACIPAWQLLASQPGSCQACMSYLAAGVPDYAALHLLCSSSYFAAQDARGCVMYYVSVCCALFALPSDVHACGTLVREVVCDHYTLHDCTS